MRRPAGARKVRWGRPGTPDPFGWEDTTAAARLRRPVAFRRADVAPALVGLATVAYTVFAIVLGPAQPPGLPHSGRSAGAPEPSYVLIPTSGPDQSPTGSGDPTADPTAAEGAAGQPTSPATGPAGAPAGPDATHGTTPTTGPSATLATNTLATNPAVAGPSRGTTAPGTPVLPSSATTAPSAATARSTTPAPTTSRPVPTSTSRAAATTATVAPVVSVTTTSPRDVPGGGAVGGGVTTGTLQPGSAISLRATTACCTGRFLRRQGGQLTTTSITSASARSDKNDATWVVRRGLADPSCLSFESAYAAGTFLRHSSFRVYGQTADGTALFRADATFCPTKGKNGQGTSFAAYNYPTKYLRHYNHQLYLAGNGGSNAWDSPALWADDVSWVVTSPWGS